MNNINAGDIYMWRNKFPVLILQFNRNKRHCIVQNLNNNMTFSFGKGYFYKKSLQLTKYLGTNVDVVRLLYGDTYVV